MYEICRKYHLKNKTSSDAFRFSTNITDLELDGASQSYDIRPKTVLILRRLQEDFFAFMGKRKTPIYFKVYEIQGLQISCIRNKKSIWCGTHTTFFYRTL